MKALFILIALLLATDAFLNHGAMTLSLAHGAAMAAHGMQQSISGSIFTK